MRPDAPREIWFLRHGESMANAGGRTTQAATYSLTERGFRQAEQLAAALTRRPDLIVHSPYVRARETAEPTLRRFPDVPVEEWPVQEVQYLDPALCVNTTQDERHLMAQEYWERCDPGYAAPEAESFVMFVERARTALARLAARAEPLTYVFCHGHFMRALAWVILHPFREITRDAMRHFWQLAPTYVVENCAVQPVWRHADGQWSLGPLWVPDGVEREPTVISRRGTEGV